MSLKKLTLQGGSPVSDAEGNITGWRLALQAGDLAFQEDGTLDRPATAYRIASRAYAGFASLGDSARARVVSYIEGQLPASDAAVQPGALLALHGYLQIVDTAYTGTTLNTDFSYQRIGADGTPRNAVITHVVREADTLQGIASAYLGSPSYWYLIAEANGLTGTEALKEGTTLTIPNQVANSVNNADTYKVYNETDLIGSTAPELKGKKGLLQRAVQLLIIVVMVVVTIIVTLFTAGALTGLTTSAFGALIGLFAVAVAGYAIGYTLSAVTQAMAIEAGLQDDFDRGQMREGGEQMALTATASAIGGWASGLDNAWAATAVRGVTAASVQLIQNDGRITSVTGILLSMIPAGNVAGEAGSSAQAGADAATTLNSGANAVNAVSSTAGAGSWTSTLRTLSQYKSTVGAFLNVVEAKARGESYDALDWFDFAVGAVQGLTAGGSSGQTERNASVAQPLASSFSWSGLARSALITAGRTYVAAQTRGEDAAIEALGQGIGDYIGYTLTGIFERQGWREKVAGGLAGGVSALVGGGMMSSGAFDDYANAQFAATELADQGVLSQDQFARLIGDEERFNRFAATLVPGEKPATMALAALIAAGPDGPQANGLQVAGLGLGLFWDSRSEEDRLFEAGTHLKFYFEKLSDGVDPSRLPLAEAFARENGCADGRSCYAEFKQALADVGINAKNAEGGSVLLVRQSDNPEQLTKEIVRQLGKGFEYEYQQSPVLQDMLAERITGVKPGSFINLSDFWEASVQETALRAYNHPGGGYFRDVVDNGGTIPIASKMLGVPNFQSIVSNDELAPIAFRNYQDRSLGVDLVTLLASSVIPFKGAGLTGGLGRLSFAEGRIGFAALKEAELSGVQVANNTAQQLATMGARLQRLGYDEVNAARILKSIENGEQVVVVGENMERVSAAARMVENAGGKAVTYSPRNFVANSTNSMEANRSWIRYWAKENEVPVIDIGRQSTPRQFGPSSYYGMENRSLNRWGIYTPFQ